MAVSDHEPITIDDFKGLWDKGDNESVPQDHFADCDNIQYIGAKAFGTRDGVNPHQTVGSPLQNILRQYNYVTQTGNTLIVLVQNGNDGEIWHVVDATTMFLVLTVTGMTDFAFTAVAGRAYISPIESELVGGVVIDKGMENETVYVYKGDGTAARPAGGTAAPSGVISMANGAAGGTDAGLHLFGVVFETDTGALSAPAAFDDFITSANLSVSFSNIPISASSAVVKRHIVATKVILNYTGNTTGYTYYFIPDATINDNVTTTLPDISFFDVDLLEDASHLLDNFAEIPAGAVLGLYHNRMIVAATFADISVAYVSAEGEPEAINQVDGLLIVPLDGNPITNVAELRDILYVFKRNRTVAYNDNDDVPATWPWSVADQALGTSIHGIATVIDQGSQSVDFLLVATYGGLMTFNGRYLKPELSWKVSNIWESFDRNQFNKIQISHDPILKIIYLVIPEGRMMILDVKNGLDPDKGRWGKWSFDFYVSSIALVNVNTLIIGSSGRL